MKAMHNRAIPFFCALALLAVNLCHAATPMGTAFTYQGRLVDGGKPATGVYDFRFTLYDALSGGAVVGGAVVKDNVGVQGGLFSVELDFGAGAYNGDARWLDIGVRPGASTGAYTTLLPRQRINPNPYAVLAATAKAVLSAPTPTPDPRGGVSQLVRSYTVAAGQTVAAGNVVTIDGGQLKKGYATSPLGQKIQISANPLTRFAVASLSPTSFAVVYVESDTNKIVKAAVGTLSGNNVSFGSVATLATGTDAIASLAAAGLSSTRFVIAFSESTTFKGTAVPVTVAGSTITAGNPSAFQATGAAEPSVAALTTSRVAIGYKDISNADAMTAIIGTVSGSAMSFGAKSAVSFSSAAGPTVARLTDNLIIVGYAMSMQSNMGAVALGTIAGNTITFDYAKIFDGSSTQAISLAPLDASHVVIAFNGFDQPYPGKVVVATINGTLIYFSPQQKFNGIPTFARAAALNSSRIVLAYADGSPGTLAFQAGSPRQEGVDLGAKISLTDMIEFGSHKVVALSPTTYVAAFGIQGVNLMGYVVVGHPGTANLLGIARAAGGAGQSVAVTLVPRTAPRGISDTHSGLIAGQFYYAQSNGAVSAAESATPLGSAISASEILLVDP